MGSKPRIQDTALVTVYTELDQGNKYEWTEIVEPFSFGYFQNAREKDLIVTFFTDELDCFVKGKHYFVVYAFSNDPKMIHGRDATSLGYFRWRTEFPRATCIKEQPPTFRLGKHFSNYLLRPEREIFDKSLEEANEVVENEIPSRNLEDA